MWFSRVVHFFDVFPDFVFGGFVALRFITSKPLRAAFR
jgi:hypothetical protein